ncbi:MAG: hypothetical protein JKY42_00145 [Flavobacteriales bacterium]|nr:hypothetical protein [Flavobacteriales bacterium]
MASTQTRLGRLGLFHLVGKPKELAGALKRSLRQLEIGKKERKDQIDHGVNEIRELFEESEHKGDAHFIKAAGIHPMVAAFIALPLNPQPKIIIETTISNHRNIVMESGVIRSQEKPKLLNLPSGMLGRRIFLYFFSAFYRDKNYEFDLNDAGKFSKLLGYNSTDRHINREAQDALNDFLNTRIKFVDHSDNKFHYDYLGVKELSDINTRLVLVDRQSTDDDSGKVIFNQSGIFTMAFPIDFERVKKLKKKSGFWNVYVFLADVLPRIPPRKKPVIAWKVLNILFGDNYGTLENFKLNFTKTLKEVEKIYPEAKGKVDTSRSDVLVLRHASPPI